MTSYAGRCRFRHISDLFFRLGKVEQMCVWYYYKVYYNESQTDSTSFGGLLRNIKFERPRPHLFFPATAIFTGILKKNPRSNLMSSSVTSTLQLGFLAPPKVKLQTMRLMAAVANITLDRWVMKWIQWSWRWCALDLNDDFPEFKKIVGAIWKKIQLLVWTSFWVEFSWCFCVWLEVRSSES